MTLRFRAIWPALGLGLLAGCGEADGAMPTSPAALSASTSVEFTPPPPPDSTHFNLAIRGGPVGLTIPTYDGSGEAVHPDVVEFPSEWNGSRFWSAFTPYRNSAIALENPSVLASNDGFHWEAPNTELNPLVKTKRGHLSDPDMIFEPNSQQLWMYYREVELAGAAGNGAHVADHLWLTKSDNGITWQSPVELYADKGRYVVSPSITRNPSDGFHLFAVDAGTAGCSSKSSRIVERRSSDGMVWSDPKAVTFVQPGYLPWHLDVQYVASRGEYWALVVAYPAAKGCHASSLFFATSSNGTTWTTYPRPVLAPSEFRAFATTVYRSTFAVDNKDSLTLWYSGARQVKRGRRRTAAVMQWSLATTRTSVAALQARVTDRAGAARLTAASSGAPQSFTITPP
jgi:hypothetical protein